MKQVVDAADGKKGKRELAFLTYMPEAGRFGFLTLAILLLILIRPFLKGLPGVELVMELFFLGTLVDIVAHIRPPIPRPL